MAKTSAIVLKAGEQPHTGTIKFALKNNLGNGLNTTKESLSIVYYGDANTTTVVDPKITTTIDSYDPSTGVGTVTFTTVKKSSVVGEYWAKLKDLTHNLDNLKPLIIHVVEEEVDELDVSKSSFLFADGSTEFTIYV